jgi:hypothetical protein
MTINKKAAHPGKALKGGRGPKNTCFDALFKKVSKVEAHLGKQATAGLKDRNTCFEATHQKLDSLAESVKALKK